MRDLYSVLNLSRGASSKDVKSAYWALAKQFHPDVNAGDKEAEGWTKEINRAYEILGDVDARATYDLELAHRRAKARRSFLRGAAAGAATLILTVGSISGALVWQQHALRIGSVKNEMVVAKAPAQERATLGLARSEHPARDADPSEPVSAAPSGPSRTDLPACVPQVPHDRPPPPRTELANEVTLEVKAKPPAPTATVDQRSSGEPPRRDGDRKAQSVRIIQKKPKKRLAEATVAAPKDEAQSVFSYADVKVTAIRSSHAPGSVSYPWIRLQAGSDWRTGAAK